MSVPLPGNAALVVSSREAKSRSRWRGFAWRGLPLPLFLLLVWETGARTELFNARLMPPPSELAQTFAELLSGGVLLQHIGISTARVAGGFALGAVLALVVGAAVGLSRRIEEVVDPTFQALRAIPSLAWVPLLLLWLGIDEAPKIALIAIGAFFPVYLNFVSGIRNVDRKIVELGHLHGLRGIALVRRILLPAALPSLFTGLRTGLSLSWMFLVAAELIAATKGLGYLLTDGRETSRVDLVMVAILVLALLGKVSDSLLQWAEQRLLAWRDVFDADTSS